MQAYAQDPSFCSFSWSKKVRSEGVLSAPKEIAVGQAIIMTLTSTPMPKLLVPPNMPQNNWSKIFLARTPAEREGVDSLYATLQKELAGFSLRCGEYNDTAALRDFPDNFGLWCFDPRYLSTSVSV